MDAEIDAAAAHGVGFFPILWYHANPDSPPEPHSHLLNRGVEFFMASPASCRMRFFIEFCNHPPFEVEGADRWEQCVAEWLEIMAHPSYLRIDGRAVFKVHGGDFFIEQNGGDVDLARRRLDLLRASARDNGLGEMLIGGGVMATQAIGPDNPIARLFDFTCTYMDVPPHERMEEDYDYEMLADLARTARYVHAADAVPYVPYLAAGWNPRPWPDERATYAFPRRDQWNAELVRMKQDLAALPNLGFPRRDGTLEPAFNIYAWNEFGEGGIVAPTESEGAMKLEEIRDVFDVRAVKGAGLGSDWVSKGESDYSRTEGDSK